MDARAGTQAVITLFHEVPPFLSGTFAWDLALQSRLLCRFFLSQVGRNAFQRRINGDLSYGAAAKRTSNFVYIPTTALSMSLLLPAISFVFALHLNLVDFLSTLSYTLTNPHTCTFLCVRRPR